MKQFEQQSRLELEGTRRKPTNERRENTNVQHKATPQEPTYQLLEINGTVIDDTKAFDRKMGGPKEWFGSPFRRDPMAMSQ